MRVISQIPAEGGIQKPAESGAIQPDEYWLAWAGICGETIAMQMTDTACDLLIRNGTLYDGSGESPFTGDIAVKGDKIVAMGNLAGARAKVEIDAHGLAVAPGFINMLSWAT